MEKDSASGASPPLTTGRSHPASENSPVQMSLRAVIGGKNAV
ncbi:MAG TPA: hypothetical protein V6C63_04895 [Allocoleopsis sp.]